MQLQAAMFLGYVLLAGICLILLVSIPFSFFIRSIIFKKSIKHSKSAAIPTIWKVLAFAGIYIIVSAILIGLFSLLFSGMEIM